MLLHHHNLGAGFYRKNEIEFLGKKINFTFATNKQLENYAAQGLVLYNELYPPKPPRWMKKYVTPVGKIAMVGAVGFMAVGAISVALSGLTVAAAPAISSVAAAGGVAESAVAAGVMGSIQTGATYATGAGLVYTASTGKPPSSKLMAAASALDSGNFTEAAMDIAQNELQDQNLKLAEGDTAAKEALKLRIEREQETYAGQLRQLANEQKRFDGLPAEKSTPMWIPIVGVATPILFYFLG